MPKHEMLQTRAKQEHHSTRSSRQLQEPSNPRATMEIQVPDTEMIYGEILLGLGHLHMSRHDRITVLEPPRGGACGEAPSYLRRSGEFGTRHVFFLQRHDYADVPSSKQPAMMCPNAAYASKILQRNIRLLLPDMQHNFQLQPPTTPFVSQPALHSSQCRKGVRSQLVRAVHVNNLHCTCRQ